MKYRKFGNTDMQLSEIGFGAWAIGGTSFGEVAKQDAMAALAKAQELGCNFVDTAAVYGESENILGEFLQGRRDQWYLASKYSAAPQGMTALLNKQLKRLKTDYLDFYQIHWAPAKKEHLLYEELNALKQAGKVRYIGVSLYNVNDISYVLDNTNIDGFQVPFSLIDPYPYLLRIKKIRKHNMGIIVRSCLHDGFLTGKFNESTSFTDANDQRSQWSRKKISKTVQMVERFRFLEKGKLEQGSRSMAAVAAQYPLSFPEVCTVVMSTKNEAQANMNFAEIPDSSLGAEELDQIRQVQKALGLFDIPVQQRVRAVLSRLKRKFS